ncbi:SGNH/GDSL hydrolase family protein [Haloferula sp.]|uniref:SGNH/GDSL hydrolase family protein n=1 Tax=Haloferula sp. TaxID=2497595 RepID=UPI003C7721A8
MKKTYLSEIRDQLKVKWPSNRTINIVCHGHSVPAGYFKTPVVDTFSAYPHLLHRQLKKRYPFSVINVIVTSIGGETSDRGAGRFEKDVLSLKPDIVTIDYALNDRRIGLKKAKESWEEMIKSAKDQGVKIILLTPTGDTRSELDQPSDPLNQHAEQIRQLSKDYHVALADSLAAFKAYDRGKGQLKDLMSQANHPNRAGHDLVVEELLQWFPENQHPKK